MADDTTAPAAPAKKLTPAEKLAEITRNADVIKAVEPRNQNTQQVTEDMQSLIDQYFGNNPKLLVAYIDASQKTAEVRLKAGLPLEAGADEKAAREKLSRAQRKELEAAEAAEASALKAVEAKMGPAPAKGQKDPLETEKSAIRKMAAAYAAPKAKEAHDAALKDITDKLVKTPPGMVFSSVSDRIKAVDAAAKDTSDAGKKALEAAKADLKKAIAKDPNTRDLNEKDQQQILDSIVANASAAVETNKKANPVITGVKDMAEKAKTETAKAVAGLPGEMVKSAMQANGIDPNNQLVNIAKKVVPGIGTPS